MKRECGRIGEDTYFSVLILGVYSNLSSKNWNFLKDGQADELANFTPDLM